MRALLALCLMLATAAGCSRQAPVNNAADVEKAVQDYVHSRPGLSGTAISIEVRQVTFHDDRAEATVLFHSREDPQSSVALRYVLKRAATRTWVVEREKTREFLLCRQEALGARRSDNRWRVHTTSP